MLKRSLLLLITLTSINRQASGNDLLDLYRLARTRDPVLQAAQYQRDATIEARPLARSQLLPQVVVNGVAEREGEGFETTAQPGQQQAGCELVGSMQRCYGNLHSYGLSLSQTLWNFSAFNLLKEADFQAASAEASFQSAQQTLLLRVAQAYFTLLGAEDQLITNRSARQAFSTLLEQAKAREGAGVGPRSDVEQAQAFYDNTEQNVIDAENSVDDARLALTQIVGSRIEHIAPLREDIPLVSPDPASIEEWVSAALRDNPAVRAAELTIEAAERDISVQRGKGLPTIALIGSNFRLWQDQVLGSNQRLDTIGISFSWPLFQGGAVAASVHQSRALYHNAQAEYETVLRNAESQTRAAYRGVVTGIQRIAAAQRAVESGHTAVEASRRNVEFGTSSEFDLLNYQNNYSSALRNYSLTRYYYLGNVLLLKQQAGRITEHDLAAIDDLLVTPGADADPQSGK